MSIESQIVDILRKEGPQRPVTIRIMGVSCSEAGAKQPLFGEQRRSLEAALETRLASDILRELDRFAGRTNISLMERTRLEAVLVEKRLQATGLTDRTAASIGGMASMSSCSERRKVVRRRRL